MRNTTLIQSAIKICLVVLLASMAVQVSAAPGSSAILRQVPPQVPLLCSFNLSRHYCDLRLVLLIDDTGSMRSNDPAFMRDQAAKNLVDILYQEYYQAALDAKGMDPGVTLPDIKVAVVHFSHCTSADPADNCGNDAKFSSGWLPITQREKLYSAIDWLKTQPNFYRVKQYTHFAEPFQAAADLFDQPEAGTNNDCVRRAMLLLTDGTPEDAAGPLIEPALGNEMGRVRNTVKNYLSEPGNSLYVTAFKIIPRYWKGAEPYWNNIAGSSNVSLETSLDGVASRMEKIAASTIGAQSSTASPDPRDPRLYPIQVLQHVKSLRLTYYKLDPNATLTLTDPQGKEMTPDGETVTQTGQGTSIEVWTLSDPPAGTYRVKTSTRGGIITTIPLYALSLQLDAPTPEEPLLQFTDGAIRFRLLDSRNQPVLPTDDPQFDLNLQAGLINQAGQGIPLALTQNGEDYQTVWMPTGVQAARIHVTVELTDAPNHSLWRCEGESGDLPVDVVAVKAEPPGACTPVNTPLVVPLQLVNARTGGNTAIDLPVHWQAGSVTVPGGRPVDTSIEEVDAQTGAYRLTINPVLPQDVRSHVTAGVVVNGQPISFYDNSFTLSICPLPPIPACSCNGSWNYLFWLLLILLIVLLMTMLLFRRKRDGKYSWPFWLLIVLLLLLILLWLSRCCNIPFWPLLILLLILLIALLLIRIIARDGEWKSSDRPWSLLILLILLSLIWFVFFSAYWPYLFLMVVVFLVALLWIWFIARIWDEQEPYPFWLLLILLVILISIGLIFSGNFPLWLALILLIWLAVWLLYTYNNPLWGVISIVDRKGRILWSARLAGPDGAGGRSYYAWKFREPICTVRQIRIWSLNQPNHSLALTVTQTNGKRHFMRSLEAWRDCDLGAGCRIVWREKARAAKPREARAKGYDIERIEGIGRVDAARLKQLGIYTTDELLKVAGSRRGRRELAEKTGRSIHQILEWVNRADLMRIPGVGEEYSDLLEAGGVDTVKELRRRKPENLFKALRRVNERKRLVRRIPTLEEVRAWITSARRMKAMVKY